MSKETGILMQPWGIEATIKGAKTQTSRVFKLPMRKRKNPPHPALTDLSWVKSCWQDGGGNWILWSTDAPDTEAFTKKAYPTAEGIPCPYGKPGDLLYIKEPYYAYGHWNITDKGVFVYEGNIKYIEEAPKKVLGVNLHLPGYSENGWYKRSPLFMPERAARHWLKVTGVQLRRINSITDEEIQKEGCPLAADVSPIIKQGWFITIWNEINARRGFEYDKAPLCWMIQYQYLGAHGP